MKLTPKLIVTDLDGTALHNDKSISPATISAFDQCHKLDIPIAIATARYIGGAKPYSKALHADYQLLTDGTLVFHHKELIYSNAMSLSSTQQLIQELQRSGYADHIAIPTVYGLYRYPDANVEGASPGIRFDIQEPFPYPGNKLVVSLPSDEEAIRIAQLCGCSQFHYRGEDRYTFFHPSASKLDAITHLASALHITTQDVMVFGDDINDMEMISGCGMGIAMGNALPEVKKAAFDTTSSNEMDGVASYLQQHVLPSS